MSRQLKYTLAALLAAVIITALALLPVRDRALALVDWVRNAGIAGAIVYGLAYVLATVLLLPGSLLTLGAGFAYGPVIGTLLVSPISVLAASVSFALGRSVARAWIARKMAKERRFVAIDRAVGDRGFRIVLLLRLSPVIPFNLLNYALGLTRVKFRDYLIASWLGMLPGTILYVYLGSLVTSASELLAGRARSAGPWGQVLYWGGLVATAAVTVFLANIARRALTDTLDGSSERGSRNEAQS